MVMVALVRSAVPLKLTSTAVKSVTGLLKVAVKRIGVVAVGSAWPAAWLMVTLGGGTITNVCQPPAMPTIPVNPAGTSVWP